jgi:hypothetical protein
LLHFRIDLRVPGKSSNYHEVGRRWSDLQEKLNASVRNTRVSVGVDTKMHRMKARRLRITSERIVQCANKPPDFLRPAIKNSGEGRVSKGLKPVLKNPCAVSDLGEELSEVVIVVSEAEPNFLDARKPACELR